MRSRHIFGAVLTLALLGVLYYFYGGSEVPAGQAPLARLTPQNAASIADAFNASRNDVRVLLLLSPT